MKRLTDKLLRFIYSALNRSPEPFVAFRAQHVSGAFRYRIKDYALTCYVGNEVVLSAHLPDHTVGSLAAAIGSLNGMSIVYKADAEIMGLLACVLLDGEGNQAESNGDCFYAYRSLLWVYLESVNRALCAVGDDIVAMLDQMSIGTADDDWLDYWGDHFGVRRADGEADAAYSNRIIVEVLRPRGNNKAIEAAFAERFGQKATVVDSPQTKSAVNTFNGSYQHTGAPHYYNGTAELYYGLFDVVVSYDLEGSTSPNAFAAEVRSFVERLRDAGTHLQSLALASGVLQDVRAGVETDDHALLASISVTEALSAPSEVVGAFPLSLAVLSDAVASGTEDSTAALTTSTAYDSLRRFNGLVRYQSGTALPESWS